MPSDPCVAAKKAEEGGTFTFSDLWRHEVPGSSREPRTLQSIIGVLFPDWWRVYLFVAAIAIFFLMDWSAAYDTRERVWETFKKEFAAAPSVQAIRELVRHRGLFLGLKDGSWLAMIISHTRKRNLPLTLLLTHEGDLYTTEKHLCPEYREFVAWKMVVMDGVAEDSTTGMYSQEQLSMLGEHCPPRDGPSEGPLGSRKVAGIPWNESYASFSRKAPRQNPFFRIELASGFSEAQKLWPELELKPFGKLDNPRLLEASTWVAERVGTSTPPVLWTPEQPPAVASAPKQDNQNAASSAASASPTTVASPTAGGGID